MRWSYLDLLQTPEPVLDEVRQIMTEVEQARERERQRVEQDMARARSRRR